MYYRTQFEKKRNDIKGTWSLLNKVINNKNANRNQPVSLHINGNDITDKQQLCHKFNTFFTQIGPGLAKNIPRSGVPTVSSFLCNRNRTTLFLIIIFIDLQKAFDTVNHDILFKKIRMLY